MSNFANKEQLISLVADMASKINIAAGTQGVSGSYVPIGTIIPFMGTVAPPDHLACDGSLHPIADYPQLADHFYENFGASNYFGGNGTTTFAVPDLRGEFLRGTGTNSHENQGSGANVGEHQDGTSLPYLYSVLDGSGKGKVGTRYYNNTYNLPTNTDYEINDSTGYTEIAGTNGASSGAAISATSRPTNTSILWCIKAIDYKVPADKKLEYYTEDEQLIGYWIGGEPIFQKSFELNSFPSNSKIQHNISDLNNLISCEGAVTAINNSNGNIIKFGLPYPSGSTYVAGISGIDASYIDLFFDSSWNTYTITKLIVTIKYTKTS